MIAATIYTEPQTYFEIALLEVDGVELGFAYDPRRTMLPTPWHSQCRHCTAGPPHLDISVKRAVQAMRSRRTADHSSWTYDIPTNEHPHTIRTWVDKDRVRRAVITNFRPGGKVMSVFRRPGDKKITFEGSSHDFQSQILHRCLKLLFSEREARTSELTVCVGILARTQLTKKPGLRSICQKIDWSQILKTIGEP